LRKRRTTPDWYHNLMAQPHTRIEVVGEEATGEERERLFARAAEHYPQLVELRLSTEGVIPMIVPTPRGASEWLDRGPCDPAD
jgi:hypothetical protein